MGKSLALKVILLSGVFSITTGIFVTYFSSRINAINEVKIFLQSFPIKIMPFIFIALLVREKGNFLVLLGNAAIFLWGTFIYIYVMVFHPSSNSYWEMGMVPIHQIIGFFILWPIVAVTRLSIWKE